MKKKVVWLPYDFDTALGINNEGALVFDYALEDIDHLEGGADVFNGQESVVWCNLRDAFPDEIQQMYQALRSQGKLSYAKVEKQFEDHQDKWSEAIFNEDAWFKYIDPLTEQGNGAYLEMMQGSKKEQRKWWLYNRFRYMDSKYNAGDAVADVIQLRGYAKANITVIPYADVYPTVKYGSYLVSQRGHRGVATTLINPLDNVNDTEIYIYSASQLANVGDLSGLLVGFADFSMATKLQSLKLGDSTVGYANPNLKTLTLGNNVLLKTIDIRNCTGLGTGDQKAVDVSGCTNVENVYFDNTQVTSVSLPNGGVLKVLHLPASVTNLTIMNQSAITEFYMPSFANISTLRLENVSEVIDIIGILNAIADNSRVRLIGMYVEADDAAEIRTIFNRLDKMRGLDEAGNNVDTAQVSGEIHTTTLTGAEVAELNARYPYVRVTADHTVATLTYKTYDGVDTLFTETVYDGGDGTKVNSTARMSTPQYSYTPNGWSLTANGNRDADALKGIVADRTVYAAYTATVRTYTVKFYNGSTVLQTVTNVPYGGSATYTGSTPTDSSGYPFAGFEPNGQNITGDTNCYAQFASPEPEHTITDTWAEILQHVQAGDYATRYSVGDTMSLNLGSEGYINMQIAGFDVDTRADGQGMAHISWISEDLLKTRHQINPALVPNYIFNSNPSFDRSSTSTLNTNYHRWNSKNQYHANNTAKITFTVTAVTDGTLRIGYCAGGTSSNNVIVSLKVNNTEVGSTLSTSVTNYDLTIANGTTYIIEFTHTLIAENLSYTGYVKLMNTSDSGKNADVTALVTVDNVAIENCYVREVNDYNISTGTIGGWEYSDMRSYLKTTVKPLIPETVRNAIVEVTKTQSSYNTAGTSETQTTTDDVWIPSKAECFGNTSLYYDLFENTNAKRIKHTYGTTSATIWWLRDAPNTSNGGCVSFNGGYVGSSANSINDIVLGFCI